MDFHDISCEILTTKRPHTWNETDMKTALENPESKIKTTHSSLKNKHNIGEKEETG